MARADSVSARSFSWPFRNPWPFLLAGLGMIFLAMLLARGAPGGWPVARIVLVVLGLTCAGSAVSLRLQSAAWDIDARFRSAGILALAALASLVAVPAFDADWDSARLVLAVLTGLALAGAVLVLLPTTLRKIAVSLLLLYHFGGIMMAVTSVAVPNHPPPWLTVQLWTRLYRPYLQFMYLNNAYHFYSPDPGPPILLWFYVQYSDGSARWVEVPRREDFRTKVEYQRRLALTESTNMPQGPPPNFEALLNKRIWAYQQHGIPPVPFHVMPPVVQYREPTSYSKKMISSYARHVARNYPSENNPSADVTGVKVYRVIHRILNPGDFMEDKMVGGEKVKAVFHPTTYTPFYQGEYDKDGQLLDPNDPFLYWLVPIVEEPKEADPDFRVLLPKPGELAIKNYVTIHAEKIKTRRN